MPQLILRFEAPGSVASVHGGRVALPHAWNAGPAQLRGTIYSNRPKGKHTRHQPSSSSGPGRTISFSAMNIDFFVEADGPARAISYLQSSISRSVLYQAPERLTHETPVVIVRLGRTISFSVMN